MNGAVTIIEVPLWAAAVLLVLLVFAPLVWLRFFAGTKTATKNGGAVDWSVPALDSSGGGRSFFHAWDARLKIATLFGCCFIIVSLQNLPASLAALAIAALAVHFCRMPWRRARRRLSAMAGFLLMFLLVMPFTSPDRSAETIVLLPGLHGLPFHLQGFLLAVTIVLKACAVALLVEPMFGTAPLAVSLQALSRLGLPSVIGQMILLSHRYIFVFLQESNRMYRGMKIRGFTPGSNMATMRTFGNFFGMLFIRSYERTQQVYEAMLCRGYQGSFPTFTSFKVTPKDLAKSGLWLSIGLGLLVLDRFAAAPL